MGNDTDTGMIGFPLGLEGHGSPIPTCSCFILDFPRLAQGFKNFSPVINSEILPPSPSLCPMVPFSAIQLDVCLPFHLINRRLSLTVKRFFSCAVDLVPLLRRPSSDTSPIEQMSCPACPPPLWTSHLLKALWQRWPLIIRVSSWMAAPGPRLIHVCEKSRD